MSYPLRLPENLEAEARERAAFIGISFNAFIAVAVDAYLHGGPSGGQPRKRTAKATQARKQTGSAVEPAAAGADSGRDWRSFHADPDLWPYVDPEFHHRWEGVDEEDDAACVALELEYWSTRQRPVAH